MTEHTCCLASAVHIAGAQCAACNERAPTPSETPEAVHAFAGVDQRSPEGHLRSVLWQILGGMGAESVESAAQRVVHERDVARAQLAARPWICDHEDCDQEPSDQCIAHTVANARPMGHPTPRTRDEVWEDALVMIGVHSDPESYALHTAMVSWGTKQGLGFSSPTDINSRLAAANPIVNPTVERPTSDGPPITSVDWSALCGTAPPGHPEHWAFVHLAVAINHLGAALRMAGVDPNAHATETTVPNEDRANLQEVFCAWKCAKAMVKEIERLARHRTSSGSPKGPKDDRCEHERGKLPFYVWVDGRNKGRCHGCHPRIEGGRVHLSDAQTNTDDTKGATEK